MMSLESALTEQSDRQVKIWGSKNQRKIDEAKVLIVGSGPLSQMLTSNLAGLGIGNLYIMDNTRISREDYNEFLCFKDIKNSPIIGAMKVKEIAKILRKINPSITIKGRFAKFIEPFAYQFNPQIIVDATNDFISKSDCLSYASSYQIPFISSSSNLTKGTLIKYVQKGKNKITNHSDIMDCTLGEYDSQKQGNFSSGIIAGLVTDEIRKMFFSIADHSVDDPILNNESINYDLKVNSDTIDLKTLRYHSALVVGAGAVGNFTALNLALLGIGQIDIIDHDIIDVTNLNRQILFYDQIGESKAKILSRRIKEINPNIESKYYNKKFNTSIASKRNYDVIFSCVDKNSARYKINDFAVKQKIPLLESGCSHADGKLSLFYPDKTYCIDCQNNLYLHLEKEKKAESSGCALEPNPSVVVPNIIMGSLMVAEYMRSSYDPKNLIQTKSLSFNSFSKNKLSSEEVIVTKKNCKCRM